MKRMGSMAWCLGLAAVAVSQLLLVTALIVVPQWRVQQSARRGIVTFFVAGDSSIRLWNRPIDSAVMPGLIRRAEQLDSSTRIRVVLSPGVPWGSPGVPLGAAGFPPLALPGAPWGPKKRNSFSGALKTSGATKYQGGPGLGGPGVLK